MTSNKFLFLATGGTIEFIDGESQLVSFGKFQATYQKPNFRKYSLIPEHMEKHHQKLNFEFEQICMKDGKDVSVRDLLQVERAILDSDAKFIIITHGTDTMVENARMLDKWRIGDEKVIIFAGAFRTLEDDLSDGKMNISNAINEAPNLPSGVYISGSGKIHKCQEVVKDFDRSEFVGF